MEEDCFYDAIKSKLDERLYMMFIKANGRLSDIPEDIFDMGYDQFVPFLNSECNSSICVYDLSLLHDRYAQTFDVSDSFKGDATIQCIYCDSTITYGEFFSSDKLTEDVEKIFKKKLEDLKAKGIVYDSRKAQEEIVKAIFRSKLESEINTPASELPKKKAVKQSPVTINLIPAEDDRRGSLAVSKNSAFKSKYSKQSKFNTSSKPESYKKSTTSKGTVRLKSVVRGLSKMLQWTELKESIKNRNVPDLKHYLKSDATAIVKNFNTHHPFSISIKDKAKFVFGDLIEGMPGMGDLEMVYGDGHRISRVIHQILLNVWRVSLCQATGKLMSAWLYQIVEDKGDVSFKCLDSIMLDKSMVIHNADFSNICFLLLDGKADIKLLDYSKIKNSLKYMDFTGKIKEENDSQKVFSYFDSLNKQVFDGQLLINKREVDTKSYSCHISFFAHRYLMSKFLDADSSLTKSAELVGCWLLAKMDIWIVDTDKLTLTEIKSNKDISESRSISEKAPKAKNDPLVGKSEHIIIHDKVGGGHGKAKVFVLSKNSQVSPSNLSQKKGLHLSPLKISKHNKITGPDHTPRLPSSMGRGEESPFKAQPEDHIFIRKKYDDLRKLLRFYFKQDKTRYSHLSKKCRENESPEVIEFLGLDEIDSMSPGIKQYSLHMMPKTSLSKLIVHKNISNARRVMFANSQQSSMDDIPTSSSPVINSATLIKKGKKTGTNNAVKSANTSQPNIRLPFLNDQSKSRNQSIGVSAATSSKLIPLGHRRGSIIVKANFKNMAKNSHFDESAFNQLLSAMSQRESEEMQLKHKNRAVDNFIFKTNFYRELVGDMTSNAPEIRYKRVSEFTKRYAGEGCTVFDTYQRVIIPVCEMVNAVEQFRVVVVENREHKLIYFDPMAVSPTNKDFKAKHSKYIKAVGEYIRKEFKERAGVTTDIKGYMVVEVPSSALSDIEESGIWTLFFIHQLMKGIHEPDFSNEHLKKFREFITTL